MIAPASMVALLALRFTLAAAEPGGTPAAITYASAVAPVFARYCVRCHGSEPDPKGGLRLDDYEAIVRGGESGPVIVPGDAQGSLLIQKLEHRDRPVMPPQRKLPRATITLLRAWIDRGAPP